jgi:hypothetical protein
LALLAMLACTWAAQPPPDGAAAARQASPEAFGVWQYPASAFPAMCLVFQADGELRFQGGFLFFNPARWEQGANAGTLRLTLGGSLPFPFEAPGRLQGAAAGTIVAVLPGERVLVYRMAPDTEALDFGGFRFYRQGRCTAQ